MWSTTGFYFRSSVIFDFHNRFQVPLFVGDSIRSVDLCVDDTSLYDIGLDKDVLENNL